MIELDNLSSSDIPISILKPKHPGETPGFAENEIVKGKVLKVIDSETAILLINGRNFTARTQIPLSAGDILALKVKELLPVPVLRAMSIQYARPETANISVILSALKENLWKSVFEKINNVGGSATERALWSKIVEDLPRKLLNEGKPESLLKMIDRSGIFWESKLKKVSEQNPVDGKQIRQLIDSDLKGLLSKLISKTEGGDVQTGRLLSAVKNLQILDRLGLERDQKIFIPLPVQLPDGHFIIIQLLFQIPRKEKEDSEKSAGDRQSLKISVLLELSRIGPIRADFTVKGKKIDGMFKVAGQDTLELFESSIPEFVKNLEDKGFEIRHIGCLIKEPEIVSQPLVREIIQAADCNIDMVV
ncbi:MAG: hypothetical protein KKD92_06250 [Proteobacteria bacterium]|nr:hypothetical protein [Pseudomonadota bacterium]